VGGGSQAEFAADELADELHLTPLSAAEQIDFACTVATKLPRTFAVLAEQAPGMTFGELRHAAHKLVLKLDPDAARKRKEAARQEAHVRRFRENSGNAGMVGRTAGHAAGAAGAGLPGPIAGTRQPPPARRSRFGG
jgi:hypothetical protein